jgi:hypothetical protein
MTDRNGRQFSESLNVIEERRMDAKSLLETAYDERIALKKIMVARSKSNA